MAGIRKYSNRLTILQILQMPGVCSKHYAWLIFLVLAAVFYAGFALASTTSGTVDTTSKYAWSNKIGWINFAPTDGTNNVGATITDATLTGYAWSQTLGWINLNPTQGGVVNNNEGTLSGSAWGQNIGWINFSGVVINSSGQFTGTATGDVIGTLNFDCPNCTVTTDWRPASSRTTATTTTTSSGGGGGIGSSGYTPPPIPPDIILDIKPPIPPAPPVIETPVLQPVNPPDGQQVPPTVKVPSYKTPSPFTLLPPLAPILRQLEKGVQALLPKIFKPIEKPAPIAITVPKIAPLALSKKWPVFAQSPLSRFVLAPLPKDLKFLARQLPQLGKTFNQVGVNKITDLQKLRTSNLNLPLLSQVLDLPETEISPGKFAEAPVVPVAKLASNIKQKIPSEVVFVKTAGGYIDLNVALSVDNTGATTQAIEVVAGQSLQLVVKPNSPVKSVTGYVVFKSKKRAVFSKVPPNLLTASLLFSNPDFSTKAAPSNQVAIEGAPVVQTMEISATQNQSDIEERFVVSQFDYADSGDGVYVANVQVPVVEGQYQIITTIEYQDKQVGPREIKLTTLVDPEGYIYQKNGVQETRITGAVASLYWLNPSDPKGTPSGQTPKYELWPAANFQQENPQVTDVRGTYSFLVPNGLYYIKVEAPGYKSYAGKPFEVKEGGGVHMNIQLFGRNWWLHMFDWKTAALTLVILLLLYNFYRDKMREKRRSPKSQ